MRKNMEIHISDIGQIRNAAHQFIEYLGDKRIFAFHGGMGAGKTTFIKAVCEELGVEDVITSPTFAIVNEYAITTPPSTCTHIPSTIYHFDFYRIHKLEEVYDMGFEDYLNGDAFCFIEWPELVEDMLPTDAVNISIDENADGSRTIIIE